MNRKTKIRQHFQFRPPPAYTWFKKGSNTISYLNFAFNEKACSAKTIELWRMRGGFGMHL